MAGIGSGDGVVIVGGSTGVGSAAASSADILILRAAAASRMAPFFTGTSAQPASRDLPHHC